MTEGAPNLWTVLTSVAPFVVSLVALGGVIWSSLHTARTTLLAEDKRAAASIAAEDRRAAAALEAEDRRHHHVIDVEIRRSTLSSRHTIYTETERARKQLSNAVYWWSPGLIDGDDDWIQRGQERLDELDKAVDDLARARDQASLYGSRAVSDACSDAWHQSYLVAVLAFAYLEHRTDEDRARVAGQATIAGIACDRLLTAMREELGSAD
jgi:hypothetical protein